MSKTLKKFSNKRKKTQQRRKTRGRKPIRKKTIRHRRKTGGLRSASDSVDKSIKLIEKELMESTKKKIQTEKDIVNNKQYNNIISILIGLTKGGKRSCRTITKKDERCELDKIISYKKAEIIIMSVLEDFIKEDLREIEQYDYNENNRTSQRIFEEIIKRQDDGDVENINNLIQQLQSKQERNIPIKSSIVSKRLGLHFKAEEKYSAPNEIQSHVIVKYSEWGGLLLNKIRMYKYIRTDPEHYLASNDINPELGLERCILDAQEMLVLSNPNAELLSKQYKDFAFPFRSWLLNEENKSRTVESYKKKQRYIFIEAVEYYKDDVETSSDHKNLAQTAINNLNMDKEIEPLTINTMDEEIKELIDWEKENAGKKEIQISKEKFGKKHYQNVGWIPRINEVKKN